MGIQRHTAVENSDKEIPVVQQIGRELTFENLVEEDFIVT
jgi:hypothetical protein